MKSRYNVSACDEVFGSGNFLNILEWNQLDLKDSKYFRTRLSYLILDRSFLFGTRCYYIDYAWIVQTLLSSITRYLLYSTIRIIYSRIHNASQPRIDNKRLDGSKRVKSPIQTTTHVEFTSRSKVYGSNDIRWNP